MSKRIYIDLTQQDIQNIINAYEKDFEKLNKHKEVLDKIKETMKEYKYTNIEDYSSIIEFYRKLNKILEEIE